tara:strand:- start:87 stop:578 length:492 start_codon:yes stop_codon:yes gene_type:complete
MFVDSVVHAHRWVNIPIPNLTNMALGGHGTVNKYTDGSTRLVIRPTPVLYKAKEIIVGLWDYHSETLWTEDGDESYRLNMGEGFGGWRGFIKTNNTKKKFVQWLTHYLYEAGVRSPDECPSLRTDERYDAIPSEAKREIVLYLLDRVPSLVSADDDVWGWRDN